MDNLNVLNLGCPDYHPGMICVDIKPHDKGVIKWDAYSFLYTTKIKSRFILTKNLLEHIPNVGTFLSLCYNVLEPDGKIDIITDNAEFIPFYFPFWFRHTGIGAHSKNEYALDHCDSIHYSIFTKMHLKNLLEYAGFKQVKVTRILFGSRLHAIAIR